MIQPIDLSIPLRFDSKQPTIFGVEPARADAYKNGKWVGDTRKGGTCNFERLEVVPHCNGTHTECVGHITNERIFLNEIPMPICVSASLITTSLDSKELKAKINECDLSNMHGLVIRTLPNDDSKLHRNYAKEPAGRLSEDAIKTIVTIGVEHLVVDLPSIDAADDEKLTGHRLFWGDDQKSRKTITEMAYIPNDVPDGAYELSIYYPNWALEAIPSRPVLYPRKEEKE